ncbi:MAG: (Fe-S)-binding protein [Calditrichaeota bacterium]|nr:MAG: (Fe-S)-binding protein [Calditrichota bacterium]
MKSLERPSPKGKKVSLFVTCLINRIFPETGFSVVKILEHCGVEVEFLTRQTCCGQPAYNGGYHKEAKSVAREFLKLFKDAEVIVTPSGSCAAMLRHEYLNLFEKDSRWSPLARQISQRTWELSEYLVDGLGVQDLNSELASPQNFAIHDSCHGLRLLNLGSQVRSLISNIKNATLVDLMESDHCCGFGGLFSIKMADVSGAILRKKIASINETEADTILVGDSSCLMHINGGLEKHGLSKRVCHFADVLAESLPV